MDQNALASCLLIKANQAIWTVIFVRVIRANKVHRATHRLAAMNDTLVIKLLFRGWLGASQTTLEACIDGLFAAVWL
jgi:hypothetical protein